MGKLLNKKSRVLCDLRGRGVILNALKQELGPERKVAREFSG
jgi:hypothetical protein